MPITIRDGGEMDGTLTNERVQETGDDGMDSSTNSDKRRQPMTRRDGERGRCHALAYKAETGNDGKAETFEED